MFVSPTDAKLDMIHCTAKEKKTNTLQIPCTRQQNNEAR